MARYALNAAAALSLLVCLAVAGLWVRSHFAHDALRSERDVGAPGDVTREFVDVGWRRGLFTIGRMVLRRLPDEPQPQRRWTFDSYPPGGSASIEGWLGFYALSKTWVYDAQRGATRNTAVVQVPFWFLVLLFGLPPAVAARAAYRRRVTRRRRGSGLCPACGYDLRGATSSRCPECGEDIAGFTPQQAPG